MGSGQERGSAGCVHGRGMVGLNARTQPAVAAVGAGRMRAW